MALPVRTGICPYDEFVQWRLMCSGRDWVAMPSERISGLLDEPRQFPIEVVDHG